MIMNVLKVLSTRMFMAVLFIIMENENSLNVPMENRKINWD